MKNLVQGHGRQRRRNGFSCFFSVGTRNTRTNFFVICCTPKGCQKRQRFSTESENNLIAKLCKTISIVQLLYKGMQFKVLSFVGKKALMSFFQTLMLHNVIHFSLRAYESKAICGVLCKKFELCVKFKNVFYLKF